MKQFLILFFSILTLPVSGVQAQDPAQQFRITDRSGNSISLTETHFIDSDGSAKTLKSFFAEKPVVISLIYYRCPDICGLVLNGMLDVFRESEFVPGQDFKVVSISIDPKEDHVLARDKRESALKPLREMKPNADWSFLTGSEAEIRKLSDQLGFAYGLDAKTGLYAHAPGIFILDNTGRISATLFSVMYSKEVFDHVLMQSSQGKLGSAWKRLSSFWKKYDPEKQDLIFDFKKVLATLLSILIALVVFVFLLTRPQRVKDE